MMMIDIEINDKAFEATLTSIEEVEGFFRGAEVLLSNMEHRTVENWRMNLFGGTPRRIVASYGSDHPVNAAAEFYYCTNLEYRSRKIR